MTWADTYTFDGDFVDVRRAAEAQRFTEELALEVSPGHSLHGRVWTVIARALPQDEVVAVSGDDVVLVHLTWSRRPERSPWPETVQVRTAAEFEGVVEGRYD
ncbi:hypothetical protein [Nocardioides sp. NPDC047086]|uniref:hypothetical protein n=1 Tax=Nocardioides sp. NPDC047086 TaxID=3154810 RepID=UPI0033CB8F64